MSLAQSIIIHSSELIETRKSIFYGLSCLDKGELPLLLARLFHKIADEYRCIKK